MNTILKRFLLISVVCSSAFATLTYAEVQTPNQIVQQTTEKVLAIVKDAKGYAAQDPKRFNTEVMGVMDKVIDFDNFARGVMGTYASNQRYKALTTEPEKAAFREKIQRFSSIFKQDLVDTYANGLLNFQGQKVETLPPRKGDDLTADNATVIQNIFNDSGKPYVVQYTVRRNKDGEWKLQNLIIEGVNLGLTYRSQFAESADKYKGDLDQVIANWNVEEKVNDATKSAAADKETKK